MSLVGDEMDIRKFTSDEWPAYRDVRLAALKEAPDAFGSTYEESIGRLDEQWRDRLIGIDPKLDCPLGAFKDGGVVGLAWGSIEQGNRTRADLYQMWTSPDCRGEGAARRLLNEVIDWATQQGAVELVLGVTVGNTAAESLYRSAGFVAFGEPERLRPGADKWITNMKMGLVAD